MTAKFETITAAHQVLLHETAPQLAIGDIIALEVESWDGGSREIKGEVTNLFLYGRVQVRIGRSSFSVDARACRLVMEAAIRRAA